MPDFAYVAKTATGERREGKIAAQTRRAAMQRLRQQTLYPVSVSDIKPSIGSAGSLQLPQRIKKEQIADLCTQLADLLNNGVPMLEALSILGDVTIHPRLKTAMGRIHDAVAEGATLDQAMSAEPAIFSELTLSMVRAGQEGAFLEESLQRTSVFLCKQDEMRSKIIGALAYPIVLGVVGTLITSLMMVFLVPKFQPFFDRLEATGSGLPMITVLLLAVSHTLMNYGLLLPIPIAAIVIGVKKYIATDRGRMNWDTWKLKIPVMGDIFHDAAVSRACRVLGTLLRNGVPLLKSLKISSESTGNRLLEQAMLKSAENVTTGDTLAKPLAASGLIPPQIMAMIRIAEESNTLDDVLVKIADRIDNKVERQLEVMVRMIEPLMLVLIGTMVMFVIVGVLLPVFDLNSTVN
ncbi:type II secretion system F family protein [Novipirellula artificiosorum]|uniref:General secretion pathway protein F n=1 Tax=Novipirellula artificiosorum TaxID=2528016 RepID=A0A5C6DRJ1_9BACT|nr:type II secretion system F family protein [Novipirellula artificiosorum]TWU38477.1 Type II secretion system protein F [Novipirellula artificiosorum]